MKSIFLLIYFFLISVNAYGQNDRLLYVIDSIPMFSGFNKNGESDITDNDVYKSVTLAKSTRLSAYQKYDIDSIIFITTKDYAKRPDSIKIIPSSRDLYESNRYWYLKITASKYSGKFIDYYLNGKLKSEGRYKNGKLDGVRLNYYQSGNLSHSYNYLFGNLHGLEKGYYENGSLERLIENKHGAASGRWELYFPNGNIKQRSVFKNGLIDGKSTSYYSSGEIKQVHLYRNGKFIQIPELKKMYKLDQKGQKYIVTLDFKNAIKQYSKIIELDTTFADAYFIRGTAKSNNRDFDDAIIDFNKAIELEPYYTDAYRNRALALIRKYEYEGKHITLTISGVVSVIPLGEVKMPRSDLIKICRDLSMATALGDKNKTVLEAKKKYCE